MKKKKKKELEKSELEKVVHNIRYGSYFDKIGKVREIRAFAIKKVDEIDDPDDWIEAIVQFKEERQALYARIIEYEEAIQNIKYRIVQLTFMLKYLKKKEKEEKKSKQKK